MGLWNKIHNGEGKYGSKYFIKENGMEEYRRKQLCSACNFSGKAYMAKVADSYNDNEKAKELLLILSIGDSKQPDYFYNQGIIKY